LITSSSQSAADLGSLYDAAYYKSHCGPVPYSRSEPQWPAVFGGMADHLIRALQPARVLDVGCAHGFLVEAFWDRGVEAWGLDISSYAIEQVRPDMRKYCRVASATETIDNGPFDLVTCIEVLEHMPEGDALAAVERMTGAADTILFSSSPYDFNEPTHINVRPLLYWLNVFQEHGFSPDVLFDASFVAPQAMLLRKRPALSSETLRLFAAALHLRYQLTGMQNHRNELARDLGLAQAATTQANTQLEHARAETAEARRAAAERATAVEGLEARLRQETAQANTQLEHVRAETAERAAAFESLEVRLRQEAEQAAAAQRVEAHLRREIEDLRALAGELPILKARLSEVTGERDAAQATVQSAQTANDQIREDLDRASERLVAYLAERPSEAIRGEIAAQSNVIDGIQARMRTLESYIANLNLAVNSITASRIWRTLVRAGGWIQMLLPGGRRQ
jgi:SAM-dependent methyltransferase